MGVQGLWHLLQPCARPTKLEALEGKRLAIDSSIWLYHFQMAMRDKEGRTLSNAHILGFLWRILKLIHYGVRPIFVFDGGAPVLKRKTLSGRRTRKTGARDDHRKVAERLLHARMREAAIAHVSTSSGGGVRGQVDEGEHGLGSNTVYMDDLAGSTGATAATTSLDPSNGADAIDDGSINRLSAKQKEKEAEEARKKKRDQWHKDPYALPALERNMASITAENSAAAKKARGGGKRPDIRFATEGELRSLLSSIQPTDLDLDSDFFRSLPTELQYELVGDLRAASRGTSYKRLQAMLAASPTPIDFSRAQIAGLKTRNELTQKVLEVTDEIGDAHIKVPIRVAGARNREYVLIKNKGDQAGFVLGVRDVGTTQEKAISVDEDSASATTAEDDFERRNTDEEVDLEDVAIDESASSEPQKTVEIPEEILQADPNDPMARKNVARELLQRRARELAKEKAKEKGIVDDRELMEEELSRMYSKHGRTSNQSNRKNGALFRASDEIDLDRIGVEDSDDEVELEDVSSSDEQQSEIELDEVIDLSTALHESVQQDESSEVDEEELELDDVDTHGVAANDYDSFYMQTNATSGSRKNPEVSEQIDWISKSPKKQKEVQEVTATKPTSSSKKPASPKERDATPPRAIKKTPGLGFRLYDREGYPERLNPKLLTKMRWETDEDDAGNVNKKAQSISKAHIPISTSSAISVSDDSEAEHIDSKILENEKSKEAFIGKRRQKQDGKGNAVKAVDFAEQVETADSEEIFQSEQKTPQTKELDKGAERRSPITPMECFPSLNTETQQMYDLQNGTSGVSTAKGISEFNAAQDKMSPEIVSLSADSPSQTPIAKFIELESPQEPSLSLPAATMPEHESEISDKEDEPISPERGLHAHNEESSDLLSVDGEDITSLEMDKTAESLDDPAFDNFVSMAEEEGVVPDVIAEDLAQSTEQFTEEENSPEPRQFSPDWSRSPTPIEEEVVLGPDGFPLPTAAELEAMEAEDEADLEHMDGDQDEFVNFLSRAKGRGLHEVRQEVEDEVNRLRTEHAATRRNEGDVTIQMAKEIQLMLRLFGLPYITAPMEAEAQCAELVSIGLADGIITDDSDVFLFGGTFIYKNMFNNKKYVECYKLSDLQHDLGMDRTKLVQLAYLLGSDYTDGLEGVGPVLAMEILSNFIGDDGLIKFRDWWLKVQTGQDTPRDTCNTTLKRIKRTLRNKIHLNESWPDENVLNAYYEPAVDSSEESFQWGLPDLDSLRSFFNEYLRWDREKTDHYLIPAIEEQNRRSRQKQGTLDASNFFDLGNGSRMYAGRARPGYNSSRLQQVITNFRTSKAISDKRNAQKGNAEDPMTLSDNDDVEGQDGGSDVENGEMPEALVGKELAKKSRPIVKGKNSQNAEGTEDNTADSSTTSSGQGKSTRSGRGGKTNKAHGGVGSKKRKASATNKNADKSKDIEQIDQEWRPRATVKRKRKTGPAEGAPGKTTLSQARNMNLDNIHSLPPSRARPDTRPRLSASSSREDVFHERGRSSINPDRESSSGLSDLE